jgi:tripeptide aminopeptidase
MSKLPQGDHSASLALVANRERLVDTFVRLARIDSPSLHEGALAAAVRTELEALGWQVADDGSGPEVGNLIARWPGPAGGRQPLFLCAHLDVVEPCRSVRPLVRDGVVASDGTTVLGADAKVGVAALLEAARVVHEARRADLAQSVELVFTWGEEVGHRGAKALDRSAVRARQGFVLDALLPVGTIVVGAPGYDAFTIRIQGRAAHAGVEPEAGISAIAVAARAIDRLPWGRLDAITTANIGTIVGGSVRNAVPEHVEAIGEVRSLDPARLQARGTAILESFRAAASEFEAQVEIDLEHVYRGYRLEENARCVERARQAFAMLGEAARTAATGGGSDANEFNAAGLECCVLGIGAEACHSVREHVTERELGRLADWVLAILSVPESTM